MPAILLLFLTHSRTEEGKPEFVPQLNEVRARTWYHLRNAVALTVRKTQSIGLDSIRITLDSSLFSTGQGYTALSQPKSNACISIIHLNNSAFIIDKEVAGEM